MPSVRNTFLIAAGLVFLALPAVAQPLELRPDTIAEYDGQQFMPGYPGTTETIITIAPGISRRSPSQVSFLKKKLEECATLFGQDTLLSSPRGFRVTFRGSVHPLPGAPAGTRELTAAFETALYTTLARDSAPAWETAPDARVTVYFNDPSKLAGSPVINDIYAEPRITGQFCGYPEMDRISVPYRIVAARQNELPFFIPVTREDFILTLIAFFQSSIEKAEKQNSQRHTPAVVENAPQSRDAEREKFYNDLEKIRKMDPELADKLMQAYLDAGLPVAGNGPSGQPGNRVDQNIVLNSWREAVRKLKAEMNAMSPPERKSQAWWSNTEESNVSGLTPSGSAGSRPLVRINKNLIDLTQPGSSIQLLVAEWSMVPGTEFSDLSGYNLAFARLSGLSRNESLWNRIFAMTGP